jgi:hypothetical protein
MTMKNIKTDYLYGNTAKQAQNKHKTQSISQSIAVERLTFKDGAALGSLSIAIEDGSTKRKVRRIVEKRVCKEYWKTRKNAAITDNKHRSATKRYISCVTRIIFGEPVKGFLYPAA